MTQQPGVSPAPEAESWRNPLFLQQHGLSQDMVLHYFFHSCFYDRTHPFTRCLTICGGETGSLVDTMIVAGEQEQCNNEKLISQGVTPNQQNLSRMTGIELVVTQPKPPVPSPKLATSLIELHSATCLRHTLPAVVMRAVKTTCFSKWRS